MKFRKILLTYLLASFIPPIVLFLNGVIMNNQECAQCFVIILIGSTLMLFSLLLMNSVQFLGLIRIKNDALDLTLRIIYAFIAPLILCCIMLFNYLTIGDHNIDFGLPKWSLMTELILCFFTFYILIKIRNIKPADNSKQAPAQI